MEVKTTDGKNGGNLGGKSHAEGGVKAVVVDDGRPIEVEAGEVIINKHAAKKNWKELSKINQSAGNGVPITEPKFQQGSTIFKHGATIDVDAEKRFQELKDRAEEKLADKLNTKAKENWGGAFETAEMMLRLFGSNKQIITDKNENLVFSTFYSESELPRVGATETTLAQINQVLEKAKVPFKAIKRLGNGAYGTAFLTDRNTVLKTTSGRAEAFASFVISKGDYKSQAKVYNVFRVSDGRNDFYLIEKEAVKVANDMTDKAEYPFSNFYNKVFRLKPSQNETDLELKKQAVKEYAEIINDLTSRADARQKSQLQELDQNKNALIDDIYNYMLFYRNLVKEGYGNESPIEFNDLHDGNFGKVGKKFVCFDCISSGQRSFMHGGQFQKPKFAEGTNIATQEIPKDVVSAYVSWNNPHSTSENYEVQKTLSNFALELQRQGKIKIHSHAHAYIYALNWLDENKGTAKSGANVSKETYTISYLNKSKNFAQTDKVFDSYEKATKWGKKNLPNFHSDMIRVKFGAGATLDSDTIEEAEKAKQGSFKDKVQFVKKHPEMFLEQGKTISKEIEFGDDVHIKNLNKTGTVYQVSATGYKIRTIDGVKFYSKKDNQFEKVINIK